LCRWDEKFIPIAAERNIGKSQRDHKNQSGEEPLFLCRGTRSLSRLQRSGISGSPSGITKNKAALGRFFCAAGREVYPDCSGAEYREVPAGSQKSKRRRAAFFVPRDEKFIPIVAERNIGKSQRDHKKKLKLTHKLQDFKCMYFPVKDTD
jgi:hypothetical protein